MSYKGYELSNEEIDRLHYCLRRDNGRAKYCSSKKCLGKSKIFQWALKKGHKYSSNIKDYKQLCVSCHRKYDLTEEKKKLMVKNLWWKTGIKPPSAKGEAASGAKLTEQQVLQIRKEYKKFINSKILAKKYAISKRTIISIVGRTTWKHI